tara:strand:- start:2307 stop:5330 length:3024 start_codon:yes stop_codon:yes gene_type:complete
MKNYKLYFLITFSIFLITGSVYGQGAVYQIGDLGPSGGVIFYDKGNWEDDWRYLEAGLEDEVSRNLGCHINFDSSNDFGSGDVNTRNMSDGCNAYNTAFYMKSTGGKRGWYMPNLLEAQQLFYFKRDIGNEVLNLSLGWYWTSLQNSDSNQYARQIHFGSGTSRGEGKQYAHKIRLIRKVILDDVVYKTNKSVYLDGSLFFTLENSAIQQSISTNYYRTIGFWVKPEDSGSILSMYQNFIPNDCDFLISYNKDSENFQFSGDGTTTSEGYNRADFGVAPPNTWYHVFMKIHYDSPGLGILRAYINGQPQTFQNGGNTMYVPISDNENILPLYVGGFQGAASSFKGYIDDITFWAHTTQYAGLAQEDIQSLFETPPQENQMRLNTYYDFNGNTGLMIADLSGYQFDLEASTPFTLTADEVPYQYAYKPVKLGFYEESTGRYNTAIDILENTALVGNIAVLYPGYDLTTLSFTLSGVDADAFMLENRTLSFKELPDFETKMTYVIAVEVSDGINILSNEFTITILDTDDAPAVSIVFDGSEIQEDGGVTIITATLSEVHAKTTTVPLNMTGTATVGEDYTLTFATKGKANLYYGGNGLGDAANQLNQPEGLALDAEGNLYIADYSNNRIQKIERATGNAETQITGVQSPTDIHIDTLGDIYVLCSEGIVKKYNSQGVFIAEVSLGMDSGAISMHVDAALNIYTIARYSPKVWRATPDNTTAGVLFQDDNFHFPNSITVDLDGNVYVAGQNQSIMKWTQATSMKSDLGIGAGSRAIRINASGNLLVATAGMDLQDRNTQIKEYTLANGAVNLYKTLYDQDAAVHDYHMGIASIIADEMNNLYIAIGVDADQRGTDFVNVPKESVLLIGNAPNITIVAGEISGALTITSVGDTIEDDNETIVVTPGIPSNGTLATLEPTTYTIINSSVLQVFEDSMELEIFVYPNPVTNILTVDSKDSMISKVEIYSILGKKIQVLHAGFKTIKMHNLATGLYIVRIYSKKGVVLKKVYKR